MTRAQQTFLLSLFVWLWSVTPQQIGEDICSCSPQRYQMILDLGLSCPPVNVTTSDAVAATSCLTTPFGNPTIEDLVPTSVRSIDILELGQDLRVLVQENFVGSFGSGDIFNYTSLASNPRNIDGTVRLPRAIQVNIIAVNQFDQVILNVFIITFTNDCEAYPVLSRGQSAGWIRFTNLLPPRVEVCPFGIGTDAPTRTPSIVPSVAPSETTPYPSPSPTWGNPLTTYMPTGTANPQPDTAAPSPLTLVPVSDTPATNVPSRSSILPTVVPSYALPSAGPSQESGIPTSDPSPEPSHSGFETGIPSLEDTSEPTEHPQASVEPTYASGAATSTPTGNTEHPQGSIHPTDDPGTATVTPATKSPTFEPTELPLGSIEPSDATMAPTSASTQLPSLVSASPVPSSSLSTLPTYIPTHTAFSMSMSMDLGPVGEFMVVKDFFEFGNIPNGMELEDFDDHEVDGTN